MGKFFRNILIGIGIGLLIAPMPGQDMRRMVSERVRGLIGSLPSNTGTGSSSRSSTQVQYVSTASSGINTSTASRQSQVPSGSQSTTAPSPVEQGLKNIAETAMHNSGAEDTLVAEPFQPAYPEYVNPERNPASASTPTPNSGPRPTANPSPKPNPTPNSRPGSTSNPKPNQNPRSGS